MYYDYLFKDSAFLEELNILIKKLLLDNNFKLSNISKSIEYKLLHFLVYNYFVLNDDEVNFSYIRKLFNVSSKKLIAILDKLANANLITIQYNNKRALPRAVALSDKVIDTIFNLIDIVQNCENKIYEILDELEDKDLKLSDIKKIAKQFLKDKRYLSYFEKKMLFELFNYYVEKSKDIKIILKKKDVSIDNLTDEDILILDYATRFNSKSKIHKTVDKFKKMIEKAAKFYKYAFFITLTVDIKQNTILEAFKNISKAFKKFKDLINKRYGLKSYIKVLEFTKAGVPHLHILFFSDSIKKNGDWLISQKWISNKWESYGMGKIVYIYALKSLNNSFVWLNAHPRGAKSKDISSYLSKYLYKVFKNKEELAYYWVSNLRFYTNSRDLQIKEEKQINKKEWEFLGVMDVSKTNFKDVSEIIEYIKEKFRYKYKYKKRNILDVGYSVINDYYYYLVG